MERAIIGKDEENLGKAYICSFLPPVLCKAALEFNSHEASTSNGKAFLDAEGSSEQPEWVQYRVE